MQVQVKSLKPLSGVQLSADEGKMLSWLKTAKWEPQAGEREPIPYKAKVPEFFGGVRLYNVQGGGGAGGAHGALALLIKKLEYQGVISKQELYPVSAQGGGHYLSLRKADLDNLGVGQDGDDED